MEYLCTPLDTVLMPVYKSFLIGIDGVVNAHDGREVVGHLWLHGCMHTHVRMCVCVWGGGGVAICRCVCARVCVRVHVCVRMEGMWRR